MSKTPTQSGTLSATLVLINSVRVQGQLSALMDGRLYLDGSAVRDNPEAIVTMPAQPGTNATLSVSGTSFEHSPLSKVQVMIATRDRDKFTLEFSPDDAHIAESYRQAIAMSLASDCDAVSAHPQTTTTLAATAEYASLLDALKKRSVDGLSVLLKPFLVDLTAYLLELSSRIKQLNSWRNLHYEASTIMQNKSGKIAASVGHQLGSYFQDLTPELSEEQLWQSRIDDSAELDLIDLEKFEDFLAIDRTVTLGEDLYKVALEALTMRFAVLIDADPNRIRLPVHVKQLSRAFQHALQEEDIPQTVLPHVFDYFAKRLVRQLGGYYESLNKLLSEHGVLPKIEIEIQHKGTLLNRGRQSPVPEKKLPPNKTPQSLPDSQPEIQPNTQLSAIAPLTSAIKELNQWRQQLEEKLGGSSDSSTPAGLYRSVIDALNFKREAEGLADSTALASGTHMSSRWSGATVASTELDQSRLADAQSIAKALSALQRDSQVRGDVQRSDSLRAYLADNQKNISGLQDTSGLTTESLNQLDMVDNLFGTIKSQLDVSSDLKPALGNLQIPLAKLALLDSRFFIDREHTARNLIDKLSHLAASANFPNKALEMRINGVVDYIISDYENDDSVFEVALGKIEKLLLQQERGLARNIERVVRTQVGQQKLAEAKREVAKVIRARIQPPETPQVLQELIDSGWRDLLVLTHVRDGKDSAAWKEQVKTLDVLCLWLEERQHGEVDGDLSVQRSMEAEPFIDLMGQQIASALPTNIAHEEVLDQLRKILAGTAEVELVPVRAEISNLEPEPAELRARIEDLPRLRRWVKRVEQLEKGDWLTYRDKSDNKKRMQLAWISPARDRYIFVNERGQKIADFSAIALARQLSRGVKPAAPTDKLSVVDQSMYQTLEHVHKTLSFARNHDSVTKLINREMFIDQLKRALRHSHLKNSQHALLYSNIDQFKLVNEVYDRINGDQVLLEFAKLLAQLHGKKSSSSRTTADEFAVLLLDRSIEQAMQIAEKIRSDIAASSLDIEGGNVSFTVSIGVAAILAHSPDVERVMDSARTAMRHAKKMGRNRVVKSEEAQDRAINYKLEKDKTRQDLESAISAQRFILRAQPILQTSVSDRSNSTLHYELLLGLANEDGSISSPTEFIKSADRYGFMTMVDRWVVREAFTWISQLMDEQKVVPNLAINLSGASVTDDSFMEYLLEQISEFGVGTSRLCFEITETSTISNLVKAADFVRAFRNIGCKFSIDDFGTGLASHNYLRELPVDYVKIDGSFITGIVKNRNDYAMARSINDLAHFLGQKTIAESVENDEIIVKLEEMGVDYLQGWGVGRPKLLTEVTADLSNLEK